MVRWCGVLRTACRRVLQPFLPSFLPSPAARVCIALRWLHPLLSRSLAGCSVRCPAAQGSALKAVLRAFDRVAGGRDHQRTRHLWRGACAGCGALLPHPLQLFLCVAPHRRQSNHAAHQRGGRDPVPSDCRGRDQVQNGGVRAHPRRKPFLPSFLPTPSVNLPEDAAGGASSPLWTLCGGAGGGDAPDQRPLGAVAGCSCVLLLTCALLMTSPHWKGMHTSRM